MIQPSMAKSSHQSKTAPHKGSPFSLPKTQPTKSSSSHKLSLNLDKDHVQTSPEPKVSEFGEIQSLIYTHRMNIDFGHLERPLWMSQFTEKDRNRKQAQEIMKHEPVQDQKQNAVPHETENIQIQAETIKEKKYKSLIKLIKQAPSQDLIQTQNCEQHNNLYAKITLKQAPQNLHFPEPQSLSSHPNQSEPKLFSIQSYTKTPIQSNYNTTSKGSTQLTLTKQMQTHKSKKVLASNCKSLSQAKNIFQISLTAHKQEVVQTRKKTAKKAPHCRIVRSYVGGSKMQVKIINYPDSSEYMRLCGFPK